MSFYRVLLAMLATIVIAMPVFAAYDDNAQSASDSATSSQLSAGQSGNKINVNTASVKELTKIKGITAAKARAIVAYRKKHGDFKSIDDLSNVSGFKNLKSTKLKQIENQISVD